MELRITPKDSTRSTWIIAYSGQPERIYELVGSPEKPSTFVMDEKNGIMLDATLEDNELLSTFEVEGRLLLTRYTLLPIGLRYKTQTFIKGALGSQKVASWKQTSLQSALLKRVGG